MDTPIPQELQNLLEFVVGQTWPTGSESGMRTHDGKWAELRDTLIQIRAELVKQRATVPDVMKGEFADSVTRMLDSLIKYVDDLSRTADEVRKSLKNGAAELQETKIMLVIQLVLLVIQLAWLIHSLFGALAIPAVVASFRAIIGAILWQVFIEVAQELLEEPVLMMIIQASQNAAGTREGVDWDAIGKAAIQSVIGAAAGSLANFGAEMLLKWAAGRFAKIDRMGLDGTLFIKDDWAFRAGAILGKGIVQGAVAIPAEMAGQAATGAPIEVRWGTATSQFLSGLYENNGASNGLSDMAHAFGLSSGPTPWDLAFDPLGGGGGGDERDADTGFDDGGGAEESGEDEDEGATTGIEEDFDDDAETLVGGDEDDDPDEEAAPLLGRDALADQWNADQDGAGLGAVGPGVDGRPVGSGAGGRGGAWSGAGGYGGSESSAGSGASGGSGAGGEAATRADGRQDGGAGGDTRGIGLAGDTERLVTVDGAGTGIGEGALGAATESARTVGGVDTDPRAVGDSRYGEDATHDDGRGDAASGDARGDVTGRGDGQAAAHDSADDEGRGGAAGQDQGENQSTGQDLGRDQNTGQAQAVGPAAGQTQAAGQGPGAAQSQAVDHDRGAGQSQGVDRDGGAGLGQGGAAGQGHGVGDAGQGPVAGQGTGVQGNVSGDAKGPGADKTQSGAGSSASGQVSVNGVQQDEGADRPQTEWGPVGGYAADALAQQSNPLVSEGPDGYTTEQDTRTVSEGDGAGHAQAGVDSPAAPSPTVGGQGPAPTTRGATPPATPTATRATQAPAPPGPQTTSGGQPGNTPAATRGEPATESGFDGRDGRAAAGAKGATVRGGLTIADFVAGTEQVAKGDDKVAASGDVRAGDDEAAAGDDVRTTDDASAADDRPVLVPVPAMVPADRTPTPRGASAAFRSSVAHGSPVSGPDGEQDGRSLLTGLSAGAPENRDFVEAVLALLGRVRDGLSEADLDAFVAANHDRVDLDTKYRVLEALASYHRSLTSDAERIEASRISAAVMRCQ